MFEHILVISNYWSSIIFSIVSKTPSPDADVTIVGNIRSEQLLYFIKTLSLGLRNKEDAEDHDEDQEATEDPEGSSLRHPGHHVGEELGDHEGEGPVEGGDDGGGDGLDLGGEEFRHHEPGDGTEADAEC